MTDWKFGLAIFYFACAVLTWLHVKLEHSKGGVDEGEPYEGWHVVVIFTPGLNFGYALIAYLLDWPRQWKFTVKSRKVLKSCKKDLKNNPNAEEFVN